jgi:transcriptional regulator with XRE-family HTH domain
MAKRGNRGKYDPKYHPQLIKWQTRSGLTEPEICKELNISKTTLYRWRNAHPEVEAALQHGRDFIDSLAEDALLKRVLGFKYTEQAVTKQGQVIEVTKMVIPDVGACAFWLKSRRNRQRGRDPRTTWQDVFRVENEQIPSQELPPEEMTHDELANEIRATEAALNTLERASVKAGGPGTPDTVH